MEGFIKLYRSSVKDPLYMKDVFTKWHAWCDLILMAYHTPAEFFIRNVKVKAKRGCVYISLKDLEQRWRWSRGKVERFLKYLEEDERITVKSSNVINCISILNYEKYQGTEGCEDKSTPRPKENDVNTDILQQLFAQIQEMRERLDAQESTKKTKKKKDSNPLITKGREIFEQRYVDLYGDSYYWQAKDAVAMDSLIKKIVYARKQKGMSIETDDILKALEAFLSSISDEWMLKNFSVTNVNSKYNEIVAQARAKLSNGKTNRQECSDKRRSSEVTATKAKDYEGAF